MELPPQHSQHIHSSERLALQQNGYVVPADFEAERFFEGHGTALMRRLVKHRGETKEFATSRLVDLDFLVILVHSGDLDSPGNHDVGLSACVADLVDALARGEFLEFDLSG